MRIQKLAFAWLLNRPAAMRAEFRPMPIARHHRLRLDDDVLLKVLRYSLNRRQISGLTMRTNGRRLHIHRAIHTDGLWAMPTRMPNRRAAFLPTFPGRHRGGRLRFLPAIGLELPLMQLEQLGFQLGIFTFQSDDTLIGGIRFGAK